MPTQTSPSLFADVESLAGIFTVKLVGPSIGQREAPIISELVDPQLDQAAQFGVRWVVIDATQIEFMNSMGLGMCINLQRRAHEHGARCAILGLNDQLRDLFRMVKFDKLFAIVRSPRDLAKVLRN